MRWEAGMETDRGKENKFTWIVLLVKVVVVRIPLIAMQLPSTVICLCHYQSWRLLAFASILERKQWNETWISCIARSILQHSDTAQFWNPGNSFRLLYVAIKQPTCGIMGMTRKACCNHSCLLRTQTTFAGVAPQLVLSFWGGFSYPSSLLGCVWMLAKHWFVLIENCNENSVLIRIHSGNQSQWSTTEANGILTF